MTFDISIMLSMCHDWQVENQPKKSFHRKFSFPISARVRKNPRNPRLADLPPQDSSSSYPAANSSAPPGNAAFHFSPHQIILKSFAFLFSRRSIQSRIPSSREAQWNDPPDARAATLSQRIVPNYHSVRPRNALPRPSWKSAAEFKSCAKLKNCFTLSVSAVKESKGEEKTFCRHENKKPKSGEDFIDGKNESKKRFNDRKICCRLKRV